MHAHMQSHSQTKDHSHWYGSEISAHGKLGVDHAVSTAGTVSSRGRGKGSWTLRRQGAALS